MWATGNWTSYRADGGAFLEREEGHGWFVYKCDQDGHILSTPTNPLGFAPPAHPEPFEDLSDAQRWAVENLPLRSESAA